MDWLEGGRESPGPTKYSFMCQNCMIFMEHCSIRRIFDLPKASSVNSFGESRGYVPWERMALIGSKNKLGAPGSGPGLCHLQNHDVEDDQKESHCWFYFWMRPSMFILRTKLFLYICQIILNTRIPLQSYSILLRCLSAERQAHCSPLRLILAAQKDLLNFAKTSICKKP